MNLESQGEKYHSINMSINDRKIAETILIEELNSSKKEQYFKYLRNDAHRLSQHLYMLWKDYIQLFKKYPMSKYNADLRKIYERCLDKEHWMKRVEILD